LKKTNLIFLTTLMFVSCGAAQAASITLFNQNFESPNGFINNSGSGYSDLSQQSVNSLYANQPAGFAFAQQFSVETMLLTGTQAFGTGYTDTSGQGGNYALGMLGSAQNDLLGLSFDMGAFNFFNFQVDISSVGLHGAVGAPFASASDIPQFMFTLFDNPSGTANVGGGVVLDSGSLTGVASNLDVLDWTTGTFAFDTSASTNGNVTLQIDLVAGGYAAFDNFKITAADNAGGGLTPVPVPATLSLLLIGIGFISAKSVRKTK
jgi:hypothetical protein